MSGLADPFRERGPRRERRCHRVLGFDVSVESHSAELLSLAAQAFGAPVNRRATAGAPRLFLDLAPAPRPGWRRPPAPRLASAPGLLGCSFDAENHAWITPALGCATVSVSRAMLRFPYHVRYELIEFAALTLLTRMHALVPLHAACVGMRGRAILFIGDSGAGKSTVCLQALAAGMSLVSEDSVFVCPRSLSAAGLDAFVHLRPGGARLAPLRMAEALRRAPRIRRRSGVRKAELDVRRAGLARAAGPLPLGAIVLLSPENAADGEVCERLGPRRLRAALAATQPDARHQPGWREFCARATKLPAVALRRTAPARALAELRRLLADDGRGA
jgi:hypothetical protein